jgi:hypothetical protein
MKEKDCSLWKEKLEWIAERGGMATVIVHPDYINFNKNRKCRFDEYSCQLYEDFLIYIRNRYNDEFWNPLPKDIAIYIREYNLKYKMNKDLVLQM